MTGPLPTTPLPTQAKHPFRAVLRTALAVVVAVVSILPYLPEIVTASGLAQTGIAAQILAVAGAVTRILALPSVNAWLRKYVSPLAADDRR